MNEDNNNNAPLSNGEGLRRHSTPSTTSVMKRYDRNGDGIIDKDEMEYMADDLKNTEKKVLSVEKEKKKYKQVAGISFGVLILVLVANFGLTIATIFLTRQFSVTEGGVLVDKSTGNQVTTKAVGNLVGVTMGIDENVAARELQEAGDQCYAYTNMEHSVFEEYQGGTPTNYNVVVNGVSSSGEVIQGTAQFVEQYEDEDYQDVVCNVYRNIRATVGGPENERVVDMVCCGSIADAYFGSENCCISLPDTDTSGRLLGVK